MKNYFQKGITKSFTQLHPSLPSSFQPLPSSIHLHSAHFSLHPALCNTLNNIRTKISHAIGQFTQINWKIRTCPFWLKRGSQSMFEVLIPNQDLDFWNSDPKIHFWVNLGSKSQSCPFCLKIGTHAISKMLILILTLIFWNSNPKIYFWENLGQKSQSCVFCLKIGTHGISRMLILIPTLVFWIFNSKFLFGQIWAKIVKVVCFALKLAHVVSSGSGFLFWH